MLLNVSPRSRLRAGRPISFVPERRGGEPLEIDDHREQVQQPGRGAAAQAPRSNSLSFSPGSAYPGIMLA